jgi:hypothetical protein
MRQLRDDTHLILDGEVRVYRWSAPTEWSGCNVSAWTVSALEA